MVYAALITWLITAAAGLYLFVIWLIEYDNEFQTAAATRLPIPVIGGHVVAAVGGLVVWMIYAVSDEPVFAWSAMITLSTVVVFGLTMAVRWIGVRRAALVGTGTAAVTVMVAPPERSFPVPVVVTHGLFAVTTYLLVLVSTLRAGPI